MTVLELVVPNGIDDPRRPSGGNMYDRRLAGALVEAGWTVREHPVVSGAPPSVADVLATLPDRGVVLVDGLLTRGAADTFVASAGRLRLVVLLHEPLAPDDDEKAVLRSVASVVTTSRWTADRVAVAYGLDRRHLHVAHPGVDAAPVHRGTTGGGRLLCVGVVAAGKGQHDLIEALGTLTDLEWTLTIVGSPEVEPAYTQGVATRASDLGIQDRITWAGALSGEELAAAYADSDLLVQPSRAEAYGMVVTEALARGVPVVVAAVGGVAEAVGRTPSGAVPGLFVDAFAPADLAAAIHGWLTDAGLREWLRRHARARRTTLSGWDATAEAVSAALADAARSGPPHEAMWP